MMQKSLSVKHLLILLLTIIFWASAFSVIRFALRYFSAGHVVLLRFLTASILLILIGVWKRIGLPRVADLPLLTLFGVIGFTIYHVALVNGEKTVPAGNASLIIAAGPILTSILASLFWKEKLNLLGWLGSFVGFGGVVLISFGDLTSFHIDFGVLLIFLAALCISIYTVFQRKFYQRYTILQFTVYSIVLGTLFLLIYLPGFGQELRQAPLSATLAGVYLGIFPTVIAFLSWNAVLRLVPASLATSFLYLSPLIAVFIAWAWLGEIPAPLTIVGGIATIAGVIMVNRWGKIPQS